MDIWLQSYKNAKTGTGRVVVANVVVASVVVANDPKRGKTDGTGYKRGWFWR